MRLVIIAAVISAMTTGASAQTDRSTCEVVAGPLSAAAGNLRELVRSFETVGAASADLSVFKGAELAAMEAMEEKRVIAVAALSEYATQIEDTAYALQVCAR